MAVSRSVPAVKADAARRLFNVDCSEIAWAVIDSGIQGDHASFKGVRRQVACESEFRLQQFPPNCQP